MFEYTSKDKIFLLDSWFVSYPWLVKHGVPYSTITGGVQRNKKGLSSQWNHRGLSSHSSLKFIELRSIPRQTITTYKLPSEADLTKERNKQQASVKAAITSQKSLEFLRVILFQAQNYDWKKFIGNYSGFSGEKSEAEILQLAKTHAVFHAIRGLWLFRSNHASVFGVTVPLKKIM